MGVMLHIIDNQNPQPRDARLELRAQVQPGLKRNGNALEDIIERSVAIEIWTHDGLLKFEMTAETFAALLAVGADVLKEAKTMQPAG